MKSKVLQQILANAQNDPHFLNVSKRLRSTGFIWRPKKAGSYEGKFTLATKSYEEALKQALKIHNVIDDFAFTEKYNAANMEFNYKIYLQDKKLDLLMKIENTRIVIYLTEEKINKINFTSKPDPIQKKIKLVLKNDPSSYATIDNFVWNRGTPFEKKHPTLLMLKVPASKQGQGYGERLFSEVLKFMKQKKIPYLVFDNFNQGFWSAMKKKYPNNIQIKNRYHGAIVLKTPTKIENF